MILFIQILFYSVAGKYQKDLITPKIFNLLNSEKNDLDNMNKDIIFKHNVIPFGILLLGLLIIFYGAYHFRIGLIIQSSMIIYFILGKILEDVTSETSAEKYYYYLLLFSFISGVLIYILMSSEKVNSFKYKLQLILYGCIFGFFLSYSIFDYIKIIQNIFLYLILFIPTLIGGIIYSFNPLKKYSFLPCSTISGSFLITKSLNYTTLLGSNNQDESLNKNNIICLIIQILLILISISYQIFHIKYKESEDPRYLEAKKFDGDEEDDEINESERLSTDSNKGQEFDNKNDTLLSKNYIKEENEDEDINDQED